MNLERFPFSGRAENEPGTFSVFPFVNKKPSEWRASHLTKGGENESETYWLFTLLFREVQHPNDHEIENSDTQPINRIQH